MKIFLDSSALAKRYIPEKGSDKVITVCKKADELDISISQYSAICFALDTNYTAIICVL
jgi:predicted nucleic acid-binding protein